ncbi:MAG: NAD(P)H-dependent oxidoreductase [Ignavibacteriales bacterium]|nr:NAD(P)H-dependent oxidoreductase [Ignavibacteriales bacterium]HOJ19513.1 NAD(P)H-dependent oxidoreductase [Ignavibacteriaceae bacterium]
MLDKLKWRYATKKFDKTKKVSTVDLNTLKEAVRLTPSSYGFQAYKVVNVENPEIREKLREASYNQSQITDASNIFVFCAYTDFTDKDVDDFISLNASERNQSLDELQNFSNALKKDMNNRTPESKKIWLSRQPYIALGNLMTTAASMGIDVCPMEGFDAARYKEILLKDERDLLPVCIAAIGYRSPEDTLQFKPKVRKPVGELFLDV